MQVTSRFPMTRICSSHRLWRQAVAYCCLEHAELKPSNPEDYYKNVVTNTPKQSHVMATEVAAAQVGRETSNCGLCGALGRATQKGTGGPKIDPRNGSET